MDQFGNGQDSEIVELLGRLKETGPEYPPRLYAARRATVIAALAALPLGGALAVSMFGKLANIVKGMSMVDKAIFAVEVVAITGVTVFGAAAAYIYRDELKALILGAPTAVVSPVPTLSVPQVTQPAVPLLEATPSESPTPTGTIFPTGTSQPGEVIQPAATQPAATQPPPNQPEPTKPGLHLGQTKTPKSP